LLSLLNLASLRGGSGSGQSLGAATILSRERMPDILHEWCMQPKTFSFVFLVNPLRLHPQSQSNGTGLFLLLGVP
jgi:hypothetical protein